MEKQRINRASRFIKGLLTSLLLFTSSSSFIFSEVYNERDILFTPMENQELITESDVWFEIKLKDIKPSEVKILEDLNQVREDPNVSFLSLKKFDDELNEGTIIQISYNFTKRGDYSLNPLIADIKGNTVKLEFDTVYIKNNPIKMVPTLVIKFSNGKELNSEDTTVPRNLFKYYVGDKLNFTVYLQYASSLTLFDYTIPQDSIFNELRTYEITNKENKISTISDDLIPIADFQWTILRAGPIVLPLFKVTAVGYDGKNYDVTLPDTKINVVSKPKKTLDSNSPFETAFTDSFSEIEEDNFTEAKTASIEDCQELASLYSKENNAIFTYSKAKKDRLAFEEKLNLTSYYKTTPVIYLYLSIILIVSFSILLFFALRKKHFFKSILFSLFILSSIALLIITATKRSEEYGISKGCTIYSIPESTAEASCEIKSGTQVLVTETTDIWYHIQQGEASGWSPKDNIIIIK